jgi:TonB family protein
MLAVIGNIQGIVNLRVLVGPEGNVLGAKALKGPRELLGSAEADIRRCRFKPVLAQGKPVFAVAEVGFPYTLKNERVDPEAKPVTGYVLHVETDVPSWEGKVDFEYIRRDVQTRLGELGLEPRNPATADPDATLDLTLQLTGTNSLDLTLRSSLAKYWLAEKNAPGEPMRVWRLQRRTYLTSKTYAEKSYRGLIGSVLDRLMPVSPYLPDLLSLLANQGDPAFGLPTWDPVKLTAFLGAPKSVDFDFSSMKVSYQPPPPPYPSFAKIARIQGTVVVEILVDPMGTVVTSKAISGPDELRQVAEDYAIQWRFEPALLDGVPQTARLKLTMPFRLR